MMKQGVLKKQSLTVLKRKGRQFCHASFCGEELKVGDRVVSKTSHSGVVYYHKKCYEELWR